MKKKTLKAWAKVNENGELGKVGCHVLLADCPLTIYDNPDVLERGGAIPCKITYEV